MMKQDKFKTWWRMNQDEVMVDLEAQYKRRVNARVMQDKFKESWRMKQDVTMKEMYVQPLNLLGKRRRSKHFGRLPF